MTDKTVFDRYASNYAETVNAAIGASGENVAFFARLKVELVRRAVGSLTPRKILDFGCGIGNCTRALADTFPSAVAIGCDASPGSIIAAQQATTAASDRIRFVVHDKSGLRLAIQRSIWLSPAASFITSKRPSTPRGFGSSIVSWRQERRCSCSSIIRITR